jgi:hypothetical protein
MHAAPFSFSVCDPAGGFGVRPSEAVIALPVYETGRIDWPFAPSPLQVREITSRDVGLALAHSRRMQFLKMAILSIVLSAGCVSTTDEPTTQAVQSSLEDQCNAPKPEFADYSEATGCAKSNPALFLTVLGTLVDAGGTCKAIDTTKSCTSIEPIKDAATDELARMPIRCRFHSGGAECCVTHHWPDGPSDHCWFRMPHVR